MKKITFAVCMAMLATTLTGCTFGGDEGTTSTATSTTSTLPINVSEQEMSYVPSEEEPPESSSTREHSIEYPESSTEPVETESTAASTGGTTTKIPRPYVGYEEEIYYHNDARLLPEEFLVLQNDIPLHVVTINKKEFDLTKSTVQDIAKGAGLYHNRSESISLKGEYYGLHFFGDGFTVGFDSEQALAIEAYENEIILNNGAWKGQYDAEAEDYKTYIVKGVATRSKHRDESNFVEYYGGVHAGMLKSELEAIWGKGHEVINTRDDDLIESVVYYGNRTATAVVSYIKESGVSEETAETIAIILFPADGELRG